MKRQGIIECIIGVAGTMVTLFSLPVKWCYLPLVVMGIVSVFMIRRNDQEWSAEELKCIKKRNVVAIVSWPVFAAICWFSSNEILMNDFLWILLSTYLFFVAHGIAFLAPLNAFANERK